MITNSKIIKSNTYDFAISKILSTSSPSEYENWKEKKNKDDKYFEDMKIDFGSISSLIKSDKKFEVDYKDCTNIW